MERDGLTILRHSDMGNILYFNGSFGGGAPIHIDIWNKVHKSMMHPLKSSHYRVFIIGYYFNNWI